MLAIDGLGMTEITPGPLISTHGFFAASIDMPRTGVRLWSPGGMQAGSGRAQRKLQSVSSVSHFPVSYFLDKHRVRWI